MRIELPVRLANPLLICLVFLLISGINVFDALGLGFWKYIIVLIIATVIAWLLRKTGLTEKEVPIWAGGFIILAGFIIAMIFEWLITNYI